MFEMQVQAERELNLDLNELEGFFLSPPQEEQEFKYHSIGGFAAPPPPKKKKQQQHPKKIAKRGPGRPRKQQQYDEDEDEDDEDDDDDDDEEDEPSDAGATPSATTSLELGSLKHMARPQRATRLTTNTARYPAKPERPKGRRMVDDESVGDRVECDESEARVANAPLDRGHYHAGSGLNVLTHCLECGEFVKPLFEGNARAKYCILQYHALRDGQKGYCDCEGRRDHGKVSKKRRMVFKRKGRDGNGEIDGWEPAHGANAAYRNLKSQITSSGSTRKAAVMVTAVKEQEEKKKEHVKQLKQLSLAPPQRITVVVDDELRKIKPLNKCITPLKFTHSKFTEATLDSQLYHNPTKRQAGMAEAAARVVAAARVEAAANAAATAAFTAPFPAPWRPPLIIETDKTTDLSDLDYKSPKSSASPLKSFALPPAALRLCADTEGADTEGADNEGADTEVSLDELVGIHWDPAMMTEIIEKESDDDDWDAKDEELQSVDICAIFDTPPGSPCGSVRFYQNAFWGFCVGPVSPVHSMLSGGNHSWDPHSPFPSSWSRVSADQEKEDEQIPRAPWRSLSDTDQSHIREDNVAMEVDSRSNKREQPARLASFSPGTVNWNDCFSPIVSVLGLPEGVVMERLVVTVRHQENGRTTEATLEPLPRFRGSNPTQFQILDAGEQLFFDSASPHDGPSSQASASATVHLSSGYPPIHIENATLFLPKSTATSH